MKRQLALLFLLIGLPAQAQTIIVVRHAERATQAADSPLSEAGFARAKELARVLSDAKIDAIYATQFVRTQQTVAPVAEQHHLHPIIVNTGDNYPRDLAADITKHRRGQTVLVVGHSDTISLVLKQLGVHYPPQITITEYDDLFICTPPKLLVLRYGASAR